MARCMFRSLHIVRLAGAAFLYCGVLLPMAHGQEPAKVVEQYVKAAGGSQALSRVRTLSLEGTFTTDDSRSGTFTLDTKLPNRYYMELLVGEQKLGTLVGSDGMQLEAAAQYYTSRLVNPKKEKIALAFVSHAQVRGKDALEVELTSVTGMKRHVFFDPQTHLIAKEAATIGGVQEEILYDDYRPVESADE